MFKLWRAIPEQGWTPDPLHLEHGVLATGPPGKSVIPVVAGMRRHSFFLLCCIPFSVCPFACGWQDLWDVSSFEGIRNKAAVNIPGQVSM